MFGHLYKESKEQTKQKQIHRYKEQTDDCQIGRWLGAPEKKDKGINKYKLVLKK